MNKVQALIAARVNVNAIGPQKTTAVHLASEAGQHEILKRLLAAGAKSDVPNQYELRPLHFAANAETARILIAAGAHVKAAPKTLPHIPTPLYMATIKGRTDVVKVLLEQADFHDEAEGGMLNWAVLGGHIEVVKALLDDGHEESFLYPSQAFQPLHVATSGSMGMDYGHPIASTEDRLEIVKLLMEHGSGVDVPWGVKTEIDPNSAVVGMLWTTPLMFAAAKGEPEMVGFLLEQGANPKLANKDGKTALHFAAEQGNLEVVELLVQNKAEVNALTKSGETPLDNASSAEVKVFLIQNGGKLSSEGR